MLQSASRCAIGCAFVLGLTSRDWPKWAPFLKFKKSKRTSKCQSIFFCSTQKTQQLDRIGATGGMFSGCSSILSQINKTMEEGPFEEQFVSQIKCLTRPKKFRSGLYNTQKKIKTFLVQFTGPTDTIWRLP